MSNLICIFSRKQLDEELSEIRAATPPKKKDEKKTQEKTATDRQEHNKRVLRSYRLK